ncbi:MULTISPECIES: thiolase family protein [Halomonadaceae]|jgi:acetyl-CoA C-acetyltransferase|uniref:Acetyl-CoA C-acetyltransferase n=3 Tax=Halomonadaceae TaxID=28256 RepID=A0A1I3EP29_9GAMM|nr:MULTISPECIES: thiolase family protein [Halomonas]ERS91667.1 acetyl-CoA acetyltransferase [Halomonas sp. PBN3]MCD6009367.1 thiolase family protein [Halomonas sp. IOP_31]NYS79146.1 thiolase family protein [Halomonas glaciei]SFI00745.1 acetyl-CoA C-acetyltransferase [Halomonas xianhensis]|tara:strand:+ start:1710 stop:2897 length:1188 start_codon:yes stop_codon:yes gene_type:complete
MKESNVVLCAPVRTAIGTYGGTLKATPAPELGATAIAESLRRSGLAPEDVQSVVLGQVVQAGAKMNPARQAAIHAGLPVSVPAMTVNRVCGSGAQAVASAAQEVMLGHLDCAIAGGMENMDLAPYLDLAGRWGHRMGNAEIYDSMLRDGLNDAFSDQHSGWHTEDLVSRFGISREDQDRWAARSQQRFGEAQAAGRFDAEIVPVEVNSRKGTVAFGRDEHNRPDATAEGLGKLRPAFRKEGTITAGNAPGLNTGAAAMIVADRAWAERQGLAPMARLVSYGVGAVEPGYFGLGPVPAVQQALARAGWRMGDVERIEINEAFAAIVLALIGELGLAEDIVNVEGGAIAHGHPIGATGAVLTTRLLHAMARDDVRRGVVTLCIGGGQGVALALERLA